MCLNEEFLKSNLLSGNKLTKTEAKQYSPLTLAFLGDAVYSLLVREMLLKNANKQAGKLHKDSISLVNASCQAEMVKKLENVLDEDELSVFKRGRNAHSSHTPKNQSEADYSHATGLEAVYGYLYLTGDFSRLTYIFNISTGEKYFEKQREENK